MPRAQAYRLAAQSVMAAAKAFAGDRETSRRTEDMVLFSGANHYWRGEDAGRDGASGSVMGAVEACVEKSKQL